MMKTSGRHVSTASGLRSRRSRSPQRALAIEELDELLETPLKDPQPVLELLFNALIRGEPQLVLWDKLHAAAGRDGCALALASGYQRLFANRRTQLLASQLQVELLLRAAQLHADVLADPNGAIWWAERALALAPMDGRAQGYLERLLEEVADPLRLATFFADLANREPDPENKAALLLKAVGLINGIEGGEPLTITILSKLVELDPSDLGTLVALAMRLVSVGKSREAARLLEQALAREPQLAADEACALRTRLVDLYVKELRQPQRALPHVEALLLHDPRDEHARLVAESLLGHPPAAARAAALLSDMYEKLGWMQPAADVLAFELQVARGPRKIEVQRRLAFLRQEVLCDAKGAFELFRAVCTAVPSDDEVRSRFVELSFELGKEHEAARLLQRALASCVDAATRAAAQVEIGVLYSRAGDDEQAEASFKKTLEGGVNEIAMLTAAYHLVDLYQAADEPFGVAAALEVILELEPDAERREHAAHTLVTLCDTSIVDPVRAIPAWRALLDSEWGLEAIERLESLYQRTGDQDGLIEMMERRAAQLDDPQVARELAFKAADLRTQRGQDLTTVLACWHAFVTEYGPSRHAHARVIPLLERAELWDELREVLESEIALAEIEQRPELFVRLATLYQARLAEPERALEAIKNALRLDPEQSEATAVAAAILLDGSAESNARAQLAAADLLAPIYRKRAHEVGLLSVLEVQSRLGEDPTKRLGVLEEAFALATGAAPDPKLALTLASRGLSDAVRTRQSEIPTWLRRVRELGATPELRDFCANALSEALGDRSISSPELLELAVDSAEALVGAGRVDQALAIYQRALPLSPVSAELFGRLDRLGRSHASPEKRLAFYEAALKQSGDLGCRRALLKRLAELCHRELEDADAAVRHYRALLEHDPQDWTAHSALVEAYSERRDWPNLRAELERALLLGDSERTPGLLVRMAEVACESGDLEGSLSHYRALLKTSCLDPALLEQIEELAARVGDAETLEAILDRRIALAAQASERAELLERLGSVQAKSARNPRAAVQSWLAGATLSEQSDDSERARRLYERVLELDPSSVHAARQLIDLYARAGHWSRLPEVYGKLLAAAPGDPETSAVLVSFKEMAVKAGAELCYVELLDKTRVSFGDRSVHEQLLRLKVDVLCRNPAYIERTAQAYRELIEITDDEQGEPVEAFERFLARHELSPKRVADRRWLFEWRVQHARDSVAVLLEWAKAEQVRLGSPTSARALYERVLEAAPDHVEAGLAFAKLRADGGDAEGSLLVLASLAERASGEIKLDVEQQMAAVLIEQLHRPLDALPIIELLLEARPNDPEAIELVRKVLPLEASRVRAGALLRRFVECAETPRMRAAALEALLGSESDDAEPADERSRWWQELLECHQQDPEAAFSVALRATQAMPLDAALWDAAESLARRLERPRPLADAYTRALARELAPQAAEFVGGRSLEFHDEWFADPEHAVRLLARVLELAPDAGWAFERLKLELGALRRWTELFELYDRALDRAEDERSAIELLREASLAAKDLAGDGRRAIAYLERLNARAPGEAQTELALERLYEREGCKRSLINLLCARLESTEGATAERLRLRIAEAWLDLNQPLPAWQVLEQIADAKACSMLERIVEHQELSVRQAAAGRLEQYYRGEGRFGDVVRMREVALECAADREDRIHRLRDIVWLKLHLLDDPESAFDSVAQLVALDPAEKEYRTLLGEVAGQIGAQRRHARALATIAGQCEEPVHAVALLMDAAVVRERDLGDVARAIALYQQVLSRASADPAVAREAAQQLDRLLEAQERFAERFTVLERLAELETEPERRRAVLGEAAATAMFELCEPERAARAWRRRFEADATDREALDGLCVALAEARRWAELVDALEHRVRLAQDDSVARRDRVRIATILVDQLADRPRAIQTWREIVEHSGADRQSFDALSSLLRHEERWAELVELLRAEAPREPDADRRRELLREIGELCRTKTSDPLGAIEAFAGAGRWPAAVEVVAIAGEKRRLELCTRLLDLARAEWSAAMPTDANRALILQQTALFALDGICERLRKAGRYSALVELLLEGATLPFSSHTCRELERHAAALLANELTDPERAIRILQSLVEQDGSDRLTQNALAELLRLLEQKDRYAEVVALCEEHAERREAAGDAADAASLWMRAAELSESHLADRERAISNHRRAAVIGGERSLKTLSEIYLEQRDYRAAVEVLEWWYAQASSEEVPACALRLADAYLGCKRRDQAYAKLKHAAQAAADATVVLQRLIELYREAGEWQPLAELLVAEAGRRDQLDQRVALLCEAATLHADNRQDCGAAIALWERALDLDPDALDVRLRLAEALTGAGRLEQASAVLAAQLDRYGSRRIKQRARVHYALAKVALAAGRRTEALAQLETAYQIDRTHPQILLALAELAFELGQLKRADSAYSALLVASGGSGDHGGVSRTNVLLALSEIAAQTGNEQRAAELLQSALGAAAESPADARQLEAELAKRGRHDILIRAIEAQLLRSGDAALAARALGELVATYPEPLAATGKLGKLLRQLAQDIVEQLGAQNNADDLAWSALARSFPGIQPAQPIVRAS